MSIGALLFMLITWSAIVALTVFCFIKLLKDESRSQNQQ